MRKAICAIGVAATTVWAAGPAAAQGMSLGEFEYNNSCVACHGASGKGDGPVSDFLSGAQNANLTLLQKNNGGVFPVEAVFNMIEGSDMAGAHGTRDMPIWGDRFRDRIEDDADPHFTPVTRDIYAGTRVLALIEYLASLQEQ